MGQAAGIDRANNAKTKSKPKTRAIIQLPPYSFFHLLLRHLTASGVQIQPLLLRRGDVATGLLQAGHVQLCQHQGGVMACRRQNLSPGIDDGAVPPGLVGRRRVPGGRDGGDEKLCCGRGEGGRRGQGVSFRATNESLYSLSSSSSSSSSSFPSFCNAPGCPPPEPVAATPNARARLSG